MLLLSFVSYSLCENDIKSKMQETFSFYLLILLINLRITSTFSASLKFLLLLLPHLLPRIERTIVFIKNEQYFMI